MAAFFKQTSYFKNPLHLLFLLSANVSTGRQFDED
jgi:hypothetical protein